MKNGLQTTPNPERIIDIQVGETLYHRYPIRTNLVNLGDSYINLVDEFAKPHLKDGDLLAFSEKVISICQKRVIHESEVNPSWLARLICKFVTKYPNDVGFENPLKMQVAINEAGWFRMTMAVIFGGIMKYVFRRRGWFYTIAGNQIAAIDGFNPIAIPPFNEYAMLAPANPDQVCNEIEEKFKTPAIIIDASNVATHILGRSKSVTYSDQKLINILDGNPMGQENEQTPILIIRSKE